MAVIQLGGDGRRRALKPGEYTIEVSVAAVLRALRQVKKLIFLPARWSDHHIALDRDGRVCDHRSPEAVRLSVQGAIFRVCPTWELSRAVHASLDPTEGTGSESRETHITWVNRYEGHAAVMQRIDAAIARLSAVVEGEEGASWLR